MSFQNRESNCLMDVFLQIYLFKLNVNNWKLEISYASDSSVNYSPLPYHWWEEKRKEMLDKVFQWHALSVFHFYLSVSSVSWLRTITLTLSFIEFELHDKN